MEQEHLPHRLCLNDRKELTMTGVTKVIRFDESTVVLRTALGELLIQGQDMKLKTLTADGGQVAVEGSVTALVYEQPRQTGLWRRFLG